MRLMIHVKLTNLENIPGPVHTHSYDDKDLLFVSKSLFKNCIFDIRTIFFIKSLLIPLNKQTLLNKYNAACFKHNCFTCSKYG